MTLHFNGEEIYIYHPEPAHTDGDRSSTFVMRMMHVGDVPASLRYPNIGVNEGGSVDAGMIAAARQVIKSPMRTRRSFGPSWPDRRVQRNQQQLEMFAAVRERVLSATVPAKQWNRWWPRSPRPTSIRVEWAEPSRRIAL
jgi:hypothetical protein